jgi:hypothetical protein
MLNIQELASAVLRHVGVDRTMKINNTIGIITLGSSRSYLVGLPTSADARQRRRTVHQATTTSNPPPPTTTQSSSTSLKATTNSTTNSAPANGVPVPDGGATALLLGTALGGVAVVRRFVRR